VFVNPFETVTLTCSISYFFIWTINGFTDNYDSKVRFHNNSVTVANIGKEDQGYYTCLGGTHRIDIVSMAVILLKGKNETRVG